MVELEAVSRQPLAGVQTPRPFFKWAGGKGQLLEQFRPLFPKTIGHYHEPFVGGGACFFDLAGRGLPRASLSDLNSEVVMAFRIVRDEPQALLQALAEHERRHSTEHYYRVRALPKCKFLAAQALHPLPAPTTDVERAARFLYLNRTCFNGLYRVSRAGYFSVPVGDYKNPRILDEEGILAASAVLAGVSLFCGDFRRTEAVVGAGDFVYFDPPYDVTSKTASFTAFTKEPFGWPEQEELAGVFKRLAGRGARVMLSNADTERVRELYKDYDVRTVGARRAINSAADKRAMISEVVVLSYDPEVA